MSGEKGYQTLEIWKLAKEVVIEIHIMSLNDLPKFELYETASQIRRSVKSIRANIVEGYGRRTYKNEFLKYISYAIASCDETSDHLDVLHETGSLENNPKYVALKEKLITLGKKLYHFQQSVLLNHKGR